jgi:hypothetical protein
MSRQRLLAAAEFSEPDRVPIELQMSERARALPQMQGLVEFMDTQADNFLSARCVDWGFFGLDSEYSEEIIEDLPGQYRRIRRTHRTEQAGDFHAITRHSYPHLDNPDYRWERRYVETLGEMGRLADAPRIVRPVDAEAYRKDAEDIGERGVPITGLLHPLGRLVRSANMVEAYGWLLLEPQLMHRFLENTNRQVCETVAAVGAAGLSPWFGTAALEMLIPPWMGMRQFDEWVFPYDKAVNDAIHAIGGRHRSHCHGNSMGFLERMVQMGLDATEPLEPPPFGDVDLAEAKRRVGDRMMLSGNVASQHFTTCEPEQVRGWVKEAIAAGAPGGGFSLRTTGGHAGLNPDLDSDMLSRIIRNVEAYVEAGLEYGQYPIRL